MDDWGGDKTRRERRLKNKKLHEKRDLPKEMPNGLERRHRRRNNIEWHGNDFDYEEEFGNGD